MSGATLPDVRLADRLAQLPDVRRAELLRRLRTSRPAVAADSRWFVWQAPGGGRPVRERLVCFSYAGLGASVFRGWQEALCDDVEVVAVQLPGREFRVTEPAYRRMDALLDDLQAAVTPLLDESFSFFGHSMGGLVAFELTRRLRRAGLPQPTRLFLSAFRAPHLPNPNIRIYHLPDEVLKTVLFKEGTPTEVLENAELMAALLPTLRADFELCDTYEFAPEPPLDAPMHVFGGLQDVRVGRADLEQWATHTGAAFQLTMLPGSHFFLHGSRDLLLERLRAELSTSTTHKGDEVA